MKTGLVALLPIALTATICWAEFIDTTIVLVDTAKAPGSSAAVASVSNSTPLKSVPINLGRHHVALSWYGFNKASKAMEFPYLDATGGEGGYFQYRYSFSDKIDAVVDGRGWINKVEDDSIINTVKSKVVGSGFGMRYKFGSYRWIFPYIQANVYRTDIEIKYSGRWSAWSRTGSGWGAGINGGAEIRLGKLISVPVDISYLYCYPELKFSEAIYYGLISKKEKFNVSASCISVGVGINWGKIE